MPKDGEDMLPFVAVGRVSDASVVAVHASLAEGRDGILDVFKKLLGVATKKLKPDEKTKLSWEDNILLVWMNQEASFLHMVMMANSKYPERLAYQLASDLDQVVLTTEGILDADKVELEMHALNFESVMKNLTERYQDSNEFPQLGAIFGFGHTEESMMSVDSHDDEKTERLLAQKRVGIHVCMGVVLVALVAVLLAVFVPEQPALSTVASHLQHNPPAIPDARDLGREVIAALRMRPLFI